MGKSIVQRLLKIKGIGYIALALVAGVALLVMNTGSKTEAPAADKNAAFVAETEKTLSDLGRSVCKVKCVAAVSVSHGFSYSYASDQSVRTRYNADGSIAEKESTLTGRTVNADGGTAMVPVKETPPKVSGVAMVCVGASVSDINALKAMIMALYGLAEENVFVTN